MDAYPRTQVKFPIVEGAGDDTVCYFTAGKVAAGMRACIIEHDETVIFASAKHSQLTSSVLDECAAVLTATMQLNDLDKGHNAA